MMSCSGCGSPALPSTPLSTCRLVRLWAIFTFYVSLSLFQNFNSSSFFCIIARFQVFLADNPRAALMVRNRIKEALRVSALPRRSGTAPVFAYMRPVFVDQNRRFLSQVNESHSL